MSQRGAWISVAARPQADVLRALRLSDSGQPAAAGSVPIAGAVTPDGATVLVLDAFWPPLLHPESLARLGPSGLVVGCTEDERVNASQAFLLRGGQPVWRLSHVRDEGDQHLEIEGTPPHALKGLVAAARQRAAQQGHDAMFSVPGALASLVSGFSWARRGELRFTRLDPLPDAATVAPVDRAALLARWMDGVRAIVRAEGFLPMAPGNDLDLARETPTQHVRFSMDGSSDLPKGVHWDATIWILDHRVRAILARSAEHPPTLTLRVLLSALMPLPYHVASVDELDALLETMRRTLPGLLAGLGRMKELDRLLNDGRQRFDLLGRPTRSHYEQEIGFSRLAVAYLASNPRFEQMVRETDEEYRDGPSPDNSVHRVVADLRRHGQRVD